MTYIERADEFKELLSQKLINDRYIHSLGVADCAKELAVKYGADEKKAYIAGLLHDVTKNENDDKQLQIIKNSGIILSQTELLNPKIWHPISGMVYARDELGVYDEEILGAIRYHTTGKAGMTLLEKIVYIADYISPERNYPDVDVMRKLSKVSLEKASLYSLEFSIKRWVDNKFVIHPDSVAYYNELVGQNIIVERNDIDD